jgi:Flp pilus assembly pilin Flp
VSLLEFLASRMERMSSEDGTTFIEYVVVAAVACVLILGAIQSFFGGLANMWTRLTAMVTGSA